MRMTPEQSFKTGFLFACAEEGLSLAETHERVKRASAELRAGRNVAGMTKEAIWPYLVGGAGALAGGAASLGGRALSALPSLLSLGSVLGVGAPLAAGAGAGYLASKLTTGDNKDELEDTKNDELVGEYERLSDEAKRRALIKRIQAETGRKLIPMSPSL